MDNIDKFIILYQIEEIKMILNDEKGSFYHFIHRIISILPFKGHSLYRLYQGSIKMSVQNGKGHLSTSAEVWSQVP